MQKSEQNMDYEVILTIPAKTQLDHIIEYVLSKYGNTQAALSIMDDAEETKNYFILYRMQDDMVYVDAIYHDLQDYDSFFE
ncbi:MAG: hypothetical protein HFH72_12720 [Lachnospiraceae bacterium]|nr:hypothetical protein [Lachnospiraceae bacterium]